MKSPKIRELAIKDGYPVCANDKWWLTGHELLDLPEGTIVYHIDGRSEVVSDDGPYPPSMNLGSYTTFYLLEEQFKPLDKQVIDSAD